MKHAKIIHINASPDSLKTKVYGFSSEDGRQSIHNDHQRK